MSLSKLLHLYKDIIQSNQKDKFSLIPVMPDLFLFREKNHCATYNVTYEMGLGLILQGSKEIHFAENKKIVVEAGQSFIVSHSTPVSSYTINSSINEPYISLLFIIDLKILQAVYLEISEHYSNEMPVQSLMVDNTDEALLDALARYSALADDPKKMAVLAPLIRKEIHFLLLTASHGSMLRQSLTHNSYASRIMKATKYIGDNFNRTLLMPDIAQLAGMSEASFYKHFKLITGLSPLQYQKELRLIQAHSVLTQQPRSISAVALSVGYESPTQFCREFTRKFGVSPKQI